MFVLKITYNKPYTQLYFNYIEYFHIVRILNLMKLIIYDILRLKY